MSVTGVLVETEVAHQNDVVAVIVAQCPQGDLGDALTIAGVLLVNAVASPDNVLIQNDCMIAHYSIPFNGLDGNGNYYTNQDLLNEYTLYNFDLMYIWDTGTYPSTQFNGHATAILVSGAKNSSPVDGTPTNTYGSVSVPNAPNYPWNTGPATLTSGNDILVFGFMTLSATDLNTGLPPSNTLITPQPKVGSGTGNYGTARDSRSTWTTPGTDLAFVTATYPGPGFGDPYRWDSTLSPLGVTITYLTLATAYFPGGTSAPVFTVVPQNNGARINGQATFTATATPGFGAINYQWQVSTNGGTSWTNISGATSSSYTTPYLTSGDKGNLYRVIAGDDD